MMNMQSRNQYLQELRTEYRKTKSRKTKTDLLNEAAKRTKLNRKYLMEKLKPKSNLDKLPQQRKKRKQYYDRPVVAALAFCWKIFDKPCGQRLETSLKTEVDRLRNLGELKCSDLVAKKLKTISFRTIDEKLKHTKEVERARQKYKPKIHPLLYRQVPVKVFDEQNRQGIGHLQTDLVEHCGASAAGGIFALRHCRRTEDIKRSLLQRIASLQKLFPNGDQAGFQGKDQRAYQEKIRTRQNSLPENYGMPANTKIDQTRIKKDLRFVKSRPTETRH